MNIALSVSARRYIAAGLIAVAIGLVIRWRFQTGPAAPPQYQTTAEKIRFYGLRVKSNPEDVHAYVELGKLEESQERYISALRRLYTARALGARERDIVLPLGRSLSHLARWDDARTELLKARTLMPDSVDAATNLAGVYYASGEAPHASEVINGFIAQHTKQGGDLSISLEDMHRLMLCYSEARDTSGSRRVAEQILRRDPTDVGALSIAGHALLVAAKYRDALPYLQKAAAIDPDVASLSYNFGSTLEQLGRTDEALRQFQRTVMLNPNATDAFFELAAIYERQKNLKLAAVAISNAAMHNKSNFRVLYRAGKLNERAGNKPEANYWYSNAAISAGKYDEALTYARKLSETPDLTWRNAGLLNMADAYHGLHRMPEYLEAVHKVASHDSAQDNLRLAAAYQKADLLEKEVEFLKRAMAKEPRLAPEVHNSLAQNYLRRGRRDDAEHELEQAVAEVPQNADFHTQLGDVYFERRFTGDRLARAINEYEQALRIEPKDPSAYQKLGIACSAANDLPRAAAFLEHAIDLQPGYGPSYEELGRVYAKLGDRQSSETMLALYRKYIRYDQTLKTLTAKADQNREDPSTQVELADLLVRTGELGGALDRYSLALRASPHDAGTRKKYDRVLQLLTRSQAADQNRQ